MHIVLICILALAGLLELAIQYEHDHIPVWEPPCSDYTIDGACGYTKAMDDAVKEHNKEYMDELPIDDLP